MFFMTHFDHCGGSVQWNKENRMNLLLKMLNFGLMKITGMGNKINPEKKHRFENFTNAESGQLNFIKDPKVIF
jgi:hypothetical protein